MSHTASMVDPTVIRQKLAQHRQERQHQADTHHDSLDALRQVLERLWIAGVSEDIRAMVSWQCTSLSFVPNLSEIGIAGLAELVIVVEMPTTSNVWIASWVSTHHHWAIRYAPWYGERAEQDELELKLLEWLDSECQSFLMQADANR